MPTKIIEMNFLSYIIWSVNPEIFPNIEKIHIRWYGLLFAMGFIIGQQIMYYIYKSEGKKEKDVDILVMFVLIATIIGARLGHVLFYEPLEYLKEPWKILAIWEGGLASHGAAFGIIISIYLYSNYDINLWPPQFRWKRKKREGLDFFWVIDRVVILVALGGCFIRMGNFVNSEIIGKPTNSDYGVIFAYDLKEYLTDLDKFSDIEFVKGKDTVDENGHVPVELRLELKNNITEFDLKYLIENDIRNAIIFGKYIKRHFYQASEPIEYSIENKNSKTVAVLQLKAIPRHPAQLYESGTSFLIFAIFFFIWYKKKEKLPRGLLFGLFLVILFGLRFVHELFKENQVDFENSMEYNMGQLLSIPLIIAGLLILMNLKRLQPKNKDKG